MLVDLLRMFLLGHWKKHVKIVFISHKHGKAVGNIETVFNFKQVKKELIRK